MRHLLVSSLVVIIVSIMAAAGCTNPLASEDFGCDKTSQQVNPHCIDNTITGNVDASKSTCESQGGKVVDKCGHGLGGCKGVSTSVTSQTTWYFADDTTKTVDDVKKKCADTGMTFVDP